MTTTAFHKLSQQQPLSDLTLIIFHRQICVKKVEDHNYSIQRRCVVDSPVPDDESCVCGVQLAVQVQVSKFSFEFKTSTWTTTPTWHLSFFTGKVSRHTWRLIVCHSLIRLSVYSLFRPVVQMRFAVMLAGAWLSEAWTENSSLLWIIHLQCRDAS